MWNSTRNTVVAFFVCVCSEGGQYCRAGVSETPVRLNEKKANYEGLETGLAFATALQLAWHRHLGVWCVVLELRGSGSLCLLCGLGFMMRRCDRCAKSDLKIGLRFGTPALDFHTSCKHNWQDKNPKAVPFFFFLNRSETFSSVWDDRHGQETTCVWTRIGATSRRRDFTATLVFLKVWDSLPSFLTPRDNTPLPLRQQHLTFQCMFWDLI